MADKHPYSPGGPGGISAAINQLLRSFPKTVDSETLKKLSIAPKNESYIINILRFIGAITLTVTGQRKRLRPLRSPTMNSNRPLRR